MAKIDFSGLLKKHDSRSIFCLKPSHDQYGAYKKYPNWSSHTVGDRPQTHRHLSTLKLILDDPSYARAGGVLSVGVLHRHNLKNIISKQFVVACPFQGIKMYHMLQIINSYSYSGVI